jgi:hypothetical protein
MDGMSPRAYFFVTPSEARGPLALAHLAMTSRDAVPKEVRDARLALGRTRKGGSAGQGRGTFFEQPWVEFTFLKIRIYLKFDTIKVYLNHKKLKLALWISRYSIKGAICLKVKLPL